MPKKEAKVIFTPSGKKGSFDVGTPVLQAARSLGVDLDSVCGMRGICSKCQITPSYGDFPKHGVFVEDDALSEWNKVEERYKQKRGLKEDRRLGCQARINGDIVIDVPPESQVHKQVVRKRVEARDIILEPTIKKYYVEVEEPDMHKPSGDLERLKHALSQQWSIKNIIANIETLRSLQKVLRKGEWKITVAIHSKSSRDSKEIINIWPGFYDGPIYGVAVDVGSTTMAANLCNLETGEVISSAGAMNPQIRFGEDLMSRVSYSMMNTGGDLEMTKAVIAGLNSLFKEIAEEAKIDKNLILDSVFVCNPVMHHLLIGIDPFELGQAPFALATSEQLNFSAKEINLEINPQAKTYILPCIAGHVGADAAAVLLAEEPFNKDEISLIVDVGTNAEIILGNNQRLLAASSPTGPAFEGAQISSGQRAAPGAIERARIDPETLEPRFKVIGCDLWSDDEDFEVNIPVGGITGICGSGIIEIVAEMFLNKIINQDGKISKELSNKSSRIIEDGRTYSYVLHDGEQVIKITQNDIRAIQLAKAALYAGVKLLMHKLSIEKVDRIRLAGAFGSHIDVKYAMALGLIPDCLVDEVSSAGNAAGTGARVTLLDKDSRNKLEGEVRKIEKIETAVEPSFQEEFVSAMAIPHKSDDFSNLAKVFNLPKPEQQGAVEQKRKRRRKRVR